MPGRLVGDHFAEVSYAGATVVLGVGVERFAPPSRSWQTYSVSLMWVAGEVHHAGQHRVVVSPAQEAQHVAPGVVGVDPLETGGIGVLAVQRTMGAVGGVEITDQSQQAAVQWVVAQVPIQRSALRPF